MKTILIVDDDQAIRRLLNKYLTEADYRCLAAVSVEEAKKLLHTETIDLLLSDINMPGESGVDLTRYVKGVFPDLPIVIISIIDNPLVAKEVFELDVYGYIVKPFTKNLVLITIDNAFRRHLLELQQKDYQTSLEQRVQEQTEEIRSQITLLETVMNAIPSAVFQLHRNGEILGCNNVFAELISLQKPSIVGSKISDIGFEELSQIADLKTGQLFSADVEDFEISFVDSKGQECEFLVKKTIILDGKSKPESVVAVLVDITERKKLERVLKASERKYRQIVDNINIGVVLLDPNLQIMQMNPQMQKWFPEIVPGKGFVCYRSFHEIAREEPCEECPTINTFKEGKSFEKVMKVEGDKYDRYFRDYSSPIFDNDGNVEAAILLVEEVTQKISLEREIRQTQKLEAIGQLAAGVAHEINSPVQYISDNIRFLQESFNEITTALNNFTEYSNSFNETNDPACSIEKIRNFFDDADIEYLTEEIPEAINQSLEGIGRVSEIVSAMREFSHPGSDKKSPIDMNQAIKNTVTVARNEWKYVANIEFNLADSLPAIPCFAGEINQVILNIVVNAAHAIKEAIKEEESGKGTINIQTVQNDKEVEIRITDDGGGIPKEIQHRIFDPFFTTKDVGRGTGQGLSIAHRVITEKHGGYLGFDTKQGVGTTFVIALPIEAAGIENVE